MTTKTTTNEAAMLVLAGFASVDELFAAGSAAGPDTVDGRILNRMVSAFWDLESAERGIQQHLATLAERTAEQTAAYAAGRIPDATWLIQSAERANDAIHAATNAMERIRQLAFMRNGTAS